MIIVGMNRAVSVCAFLLLFLLPASGEASNRSQEIVSVSGIVMDTSGAAVAGAQVSLVLSDGTPLQTLTSGTRGEFTFTAVPVGSYAVKVDAAGFNPFITETFAITARQVYVVPAISLSIAAVTADVTVRPTDVIAAGQIKAEEKQRLIGVFPNFYVSYVPDAAPLTSRQKLSLATRDTFDSMSLAGNGLGAGIEQATNAHAAYRQGAAGYGKRWAALIADNVSDDLLSHYVFASALHQDPRYFYQGTGTKKARLYHALSSALVAHSDSGKLMPNYAYLLGDVSSAALSNAYYPRADRNVNWFLINVAVAIAGRAGEAVAQEFIGKHLTRNVPAS
jgi:hypothetical protein